MEKFDKGKIEDSQKLLERALESLEHHFGKENLFVARALLYLGHIQFTKDNFKEALVYYERAMPILLQNFEADHPDIQ